MELCRDAGVPRSAEASRESSLPVPVPRSRAQAWRALLAQHCDGIARSTPINPDEPGSTQLKPDQPLIGRLLDAGCPRQRIAAP